MGTPRIEPAMTAAAVCLVTPFAVLAVGGLVSAAGGGAGFQLVSSGDLGYIAFLTTPLAFAAASQRPRSRLSSRDHRDSSLSSSSGAQAGRCGPGR